MLEGMSLGSPQHLYQVICRLVALAYPSADESLTTYVAKEALITALNDNKLQLEVMKRVAHNVEEALSHAIKLEAYEQSLLLHNAVSSDEFDESRPRRRPRNVCSVIDPSGAGDTAMLRKQVGELQEALAQATKGMAAMAAGPRSDQAASAAVTQKTCAVPDAIPPPSMPAQVSSSSDGKWSRGGGRGRGLHCRTRDTDPC